MKKCSEKYQTSTWSRKKLDTMDLVEQNTKLELERHQNEEKKKWTKMNPWGRICIYREGSVFTCFWKHRRICSKNIIDVKEVHCIKNINTSYQSLIRETWGDEIQDASPSSQNMESKLLKRSGDEVCIINESNRQGNIIFSKTLSLSDVLHKENNTTKSPDV